MYQKMNKYIIFHFKYFTKSTVKIIEFESTDKLINYSIKLQFLSLNY